MFHIGTNFDNLDYKNKKTGNFCSAIIYKVADIITDV